MAVMRLLWTFLASFKMFSSPLLTAESLATRLGTFPHGFVAFPPDSVLSVVLFVAVFFCVAFGVTVCVSMKEVKKLKKERDYAKRDAQRARTEFANLPRTERELLEEVRRLKGERDGPKREVELAQKTAEMAKHDASIPRAEVASLRQSSDFLSPQLRAQLIEAGLSQVLDGSAQGLAQALSMPSDDFLKWKERLVLPQLHNFVQKLCASHRKRFAATSELMFPPQIEIVSVDLTTPRASVTSSFRALREEFLILGRHWTPRVTGLTNVSSSFLCSHPVLSGSANARVFSMKAGETLLFHGATDQRISRISVEGFDQRRSGEGAGMMFGQGTSFALNFSKADLYAGPSERRFRKYKGAMKVVVSAVLLGKCMADTSRNGSRRRTPDHSILCGAFRKNSGGRLIILSL